MRKRTCHHVTDQQLREEGRAGVFRSTDEEQRSLALAAVRQGFGTPKEVANFVSGGGFIIDEDKALELLQELVRRREVLKYDKTYRSAK